MATSNKALQAKLDKLKKKNDDIKERRDLLSKLEAEKKRGENIRSGKSVSTRKRR